MLGIDLQRIAARLRAQGVVKLNRLRRLGRNYKLGLVFIAVALYRTLLPRRQVYRPEPRNICVVRLDALGDVLMSTGILHALRERYPRAIITVVVQQRCATILETNPHINRIVRLPRVGRTRLMQSLREELAILALYRRTLSNQEIDVVLQPRAGFDYLAENLLVKLLDAPVTIRYRDEARGPARLILDHAFARAINLDKGEPQHEVSRNGRLVERLTGLNTRWSPEIFLRDSDREYSRRLMSEIDEDTIPVCVAFTAQAKKREWPLDLWAEVIDRLARKWDTHPILVCALSERMLGRELQKKLRTDSSLVADKSVRQAAAVIEDCELFLGVDSGLAHIAAAVGTYAVVLSPHPRGGDPEHDNSPVRFRPYSQRAVVVQPQSAVPPCTTGCDAIQPHCILGVGTGDVIEACDRVLWAARERRLLNRYIDSKRV
jgi:ADP-heptose:LPS heptosyltransferase